MTEFTPRLFVDDTSVRRVGLGLLNRTLPRAEWTHEAHLAACLWLVRERTDIDLERELPGIIRSYNVSVGGVNDATQGYHETLTQLYLAAVRCWDIGQSGQPLAAAVNALITSPVGKRDWPLTLYSHDRLFSVDARLGLVMPDRGDWPGQAITGAAPTSDN